MRKKIKTQVLAFSLIGILVLEVGFIFISRGLS